MWRPQKPTKVQPATAFGCSAGRPHQPQAERSWHSRAPGRDPLGQCLLRLAATASGLLCQANYASAKQGLRDCMRSQGHFSVRQLLLQRRWRVRQDDGIQTAAHPVPAPYSLGPCRQDPAAKEEQKRVLDHIPQPVLLLLACTGGPRTTCKSGSKIPSLEQTAKLAQGTPWMSAHGEDTLPRRASGIQITTTKTQLGKGKGEDNATLRGHSQSLNPVQPVSPSKTAPEASEL